MTRFHLPFLTAAGIFAVVFSSACQFASSTAIAQDDIVRVEEDWVLVVGTPDLNSVSPQLTCVFAPSSDFHSLSGVFELNHQSQPDFSSGGLHLHLWEGTYPLDVRSSHCDCVMSKSNETVRWTQAMTIVDGHLEIEVINGTSLTWGEFGDEGHLKISMPTSLDDLNSYNPQFSVDNSGVGYAAHRVQSLVIKRIRRFTDDGEVLEDSTVRTVYPQN